MREPEVTLWLETQRQTGDVYEAFVVSFCCHIAIALRGRKNQMSKIDSIPRECDRSLSIHLYYQQDFLQQ